MYERLTTRVVRRPWAAILTVVALTAAFASFIPQLRTSSDLMDFLPLHDEARVNEGVLEKRFGSTQIARIMIAREDHPDGIYAPGTLQVVSDVTEWLQARPEFETSRNADLRALGTVNDILGGEGGMVVEPFMETVPQTREEALELRSALEENGIYLGVLVAADAKAASIIVRLSTEGAADRRGTYFTLRDYLDRLAASGRPERFYVSGRPVVEGMFDYYITDEANRMLPVVLAMLALFLFFAFRNTRGVLIPLTLIAATELWMFGFLAAWGHPVYSITTIIPILICSIAIADAIHLLAKFEETTAASPETDKKTILVSTMREMGPPLFMTSLTTAIGFLSMTSSQVMPLSDFGVTISVGIAAAFLLTIVVIPAVLSLLPRLEARPATRGSHAPLLRHALERPTAAAARHPRATIVVFLAAFALAGTGMLRLSTDSSQVNQFRPGHHLRVADAFDNAHFAGSNILDVMIDGGTEGAIKDPALLRRIDTFQHEIERTPHVGDSLSIAELIKRMNRVMNEDRKEMETVPDSRDLVAQYLLLYSISGDPGDLDDLVDYDYRHAHVFVFVNDSGTAAARRVVDRTKELAASLFDSAGGPHAEVSLAGIAYSNARLETYVTDSQLTTLAVCVPVLLLLTWLMFGRFTVAALAIAPVSLAIVGVYGLMGFLDVPTDIATTLLGGMSLGIGIDFAIHYLHKYRLCITCGMDHESATRVTAATTGRALFFNALVLIGGFIVLLGARFYPQVKLGALVSATMLICYTATVLLFPAVLRYVRFEVPPAEDATDSASVGATDERIAAGAR